MSFLDEVVAVLEETGKAMHVNEIAERLGDSKLLAKEGQLALAGRIATALSSHVQSASPRVQRTTRDGRSKGIYRIKKIKIKTPILPTPDVKDLTSNYVGKAGEYAVMSELLFWGFNVSLMSVDEGIDVIATKNNEYFHIQVKTTSACNDKGVFGFGIERKKFERNNKAHTFYILVMRDDSATRYVVLPSSEISRLIGAGHIAGQHTYSIRVSVDPLTKRYVLNGSESMQEWINGFQFIR